jgi:hypothetical protein
VGWMYQLYTYSTICVIVNFSLVMCLCFGIGVKTICFLLWFFLVLHCEVIKEVRLVYYFLYKWAS